MYSKGNIQVEINEFGHIRNPKKAAKRRRRQAEKKALEEAETAVVKLEE